MPRTARHVASGLTYHVLNRGNGRQRIFRKDGDFAAFVDLLIEGKRHAEVEVLAYCVMGNHFHLAVIPRTGRDLARYLGWVCNTHVKRYRAHYPQTSGHLYQGRYKSFVVQEDRHLLVLLRYVEANARRAGLVRRAQDWRWCSAGCDAETADKLLDAWPIDRPGNWAALVNRPLDDEQVGLVRQCVARGRPLGEEQWVQRMAKRLGLTHTLRPRGRPRKVAT
jgi:putative transposase